MERQGWQGGDMNKMMPDPFQEGTKSSICKNIEKETQMFNISTRKPPVTMHTGRCRLHSFIFTGIIKI